MELRPYQKDAVAAAFASLRRGENPALQLATGTGKSLIIAAITMTARLKPERVVWVLTHSQTLVEQNAATYERFAEVEAGIVCAGLGKADYQSPVIFATIQSIISPALRGETSEPDLIIIDEAHRGSYATGEIGQYGRIFERYPAARRIAMTATPWRTDNGLIYGKGEQFWFDTLAYSYNVPEAVYDGWLCPLVGVETESQLTITEQAQSGSDFVMAKVEQDETIEWLYEVAESIKFLAAKRKRIAVYCPTILAAERAALAIANTTGWKTNIITGGMSKSVRSDVLNKFRSGELRVLCSVDTITTGFDLPELDCIVCLRPTVSSSLWVQIMGRGVRLAPNKHNCLLLDYVGNLQRMGGVDMLETYVRQKGVEASEPIVWEPPEKVERISYPGVSSIIPLDPMSGEQARDGAELTVTVHKVSCIAIPTRRDPENPALLVQYRCSTPEGAKIDGSLFLQTHLVNAQTEQFFKNRELAVNLPSPAKSLTWQMKGARMPRVVVVRKAGKYWNVVSEQF